MALVCPKSAATTKWLGFVMAIWVQAIAGNNYTFLKYSVALKSLLGLTQLQLSNLSVAKDVGKAFGILSAGFASDESDWFPTSVTLIIGAVEGVIRYGVQWLVVSQRISPLPYWHVNYVIVKWRLEKPVEKQLYRYKPLRVGRV